MPRQPIKKSGPFQKPRSKTVKKRTHKIVDRDKRLPKIEIVRRKPNSVHPKYGTSKLEEKFAREFLDKLGLKYTYQFEAKLIGRFFDFRIEPHGPIIEIQGSYWHGDNRIYEEKDLNNTQKRNMRVDEIKRKWCEMNGISLIYIWEKDINNDPDGVLEYLRRRLKNYLPDAPKRKGRKILEDDNKNKNTRN